MYLSYVAVGVYTRDKKKKLKERKSAPTYIITQYIRLPVESTQARFFFNSRHGFQHAMLMYTNTGNVNVGMSDCYKIVCEM